MNAPGKPPLRHYAIPLPVRLAALWSAVTLCYAYGDIFGMYTPGGIERIAAGNIGPTGQITPGILVGIAAMMSVPAAMVALSVLLPAPANRALNMVFGVLFTLIMLATMTSAPPFYVYLGVVEVILTLTIVWLAWKWPRGIAAD